MTPRTHEPPPLVPVAAVVPPPVHGAHRRRAPRTRSRRIWVIAAVALVVVAALGIGLSRLGETPPHRAAAPVGRTQRTLLLGIGPAGGAGQSVVVYAADAAARTAGAVVLPPDALVDGPGQTVAGSYALGGSELVGTVGDLLGVRVDASWALTPAGLAALVDRVGGVPLVVDTDIPPLGLTAGPQTLGGAQAAAYATYAGDTEQALGNRTRLVLDALLAKLPATGLPALLGGLPGSTSSLPAAQLAAYLQQLQTGDVSGDEQLLPVTALDTGGTSPAYTLDTARAPATLSAVFGASRVQASSGPTRVEVVDDVGQPGLVTSARARLTAGGLSFVRAIDDQPSHQYARSTVVVFDSSPASIAFGHRVASALGIPSAPVLVSAQGTSVTDALAVLAGDYHG